MRRRRMLFALLTAMLVACQPSTATPPARVFPTPRLPVATAGPAAPAPPRPTDAPPSSISPPPSELAPDFRRQIVPLPSLESPADTASDPLQAPWMAALIDAPILLIAAPTHGAREFAVLRERFVRYRLSKGAVAVLLEADWGGVLALNNYVVSDRGDPQSAVASLTGGWNNGELYDLIAGLHAHNRDAPLPRRARVLGFDAGLPASAMDAVEAFVQRAGEPALLQEIRTRYACLRPYARAAAGYAAQPASVTSECRAALQGVSDALERVDNLKGDALGYAIAQMSAHVVLQAEDLLMLGDAPEAEALRTRYQSDNISQIARSGMPVIVLLRTHQADLAATAPKSIATQLRERFGDDVRSIALTHADGSFRARPGSLESNGVRRASTPPAGSYEHAFAGVGGPFALNTRPPEIPAWLAASRLFRGAGPRYDEADPATHFAPVALARAFDAVIFVPEVSPVEPLTGGAGSGLFLIPRNLDFEDGTENWWAFTGNPLQHSFGVDRNDPHGGTYSLYLGSGGSSAPFTRRSTVGQTVSGARYRGKRLLVSAFLRTRDVEHAAGMLVAMSPARSPTFALAVRDTMAGRELSGTTPWRRVDIVVDVPNTEMSLAVALWLEGPGTVWMDDVRFEAVGDDVPTTYGIGLPGIPRNLSFTDSTDGWRVEAEVRSEWEFAAQDGGAYLASRTARPAGSASAEQPISAEPYRGKRVRLSGLVRTTGVRDAAGLVLSASSARMVWNAERDGAATGTTAWVPRSVEFDVPESAGILHLQIRLGGVGRIEVKNLALEILTR